MEKNDFEKFARANNGISSLTIDSYKANTIPLTSSMISPTIVEERQMNAVVMDVFSRLMMDRIVFIGSPIDDTVANIINAQLLWLESVDSNLPISMYINSPGGEVYSGLGIYDVMNYIKPPVNTINTGLAASMAAILLSSGEKGGRSSLKHARTLIHQPLGGAQGQSSDIEIAAKQILEMKSELNEILVKNSGKPIGKIKKDTDRDYWMSAVEAKKYGLIDTII